MSFLEEKKKEETRFIQVVVPQDKTIFGMTVSTDIVGDEVIERIKPYLKDYFRSVKLDNWVWHPVKNYGEPIEKHYVPLNQMDRDKFYLSYSPQDEPKDYRPIILYGVQKPNALKAPSIRPNIEEIEL